MIVYDKLGILHYNLKGTETKQFYQDPKKHLGVAPIILLFTASLIFNNFTSGWSFNFNPSYYHLVVFGILLCFGAYLFFGKQAEKVTLSRIDVILITWVIYIFVNLLVIHRDFSITNSRLSLMGLFFIYLFFRSSTVSHNLFSCQIVLVFLGVLSAGYGGLQYLEILPSNSNEFPISGFFSNPVPHTAFLTCVWPFLLSIWVRLRGQKAKYQTAMDIVFVLLSGSFLGNIVLCQSRAAFFGTIIGTFLFLGQYYQWGKKWNTLRSKRYLIVIFGLTLFALTAFLIQLKMDSSYGRLLIWRVCLDMIREHPIFGIGYDRFVIHYPNYQALFFENNVTTEYTEKIAGMTYYAFNDFIQILTEQGIMGAALFALIVWSALKTKGKNESGSPLKSSLVSILIFGLFSYPLSIVPIQMVFMFILAHIASGEPAIVDLNFTNVRWKISATTIIALNIYGLATVDATLGALKDWRQAATYIQLQETKALKLYESSYPILKDNGDFLFNYGAELSTLGYHTQSLEILDLAKKRFNHIDLHLFQGNNHLALKQYKMAEDCYLMASNMIPNRFYPKYLLVKLYQETNQLNRARNFAKEIISANPKVPSKLIDDWKNEMRIFIATQP